MKKKLLLLTVIATFAFALCGCDSEEKETTEATTTEATTEATTEEATEAATEAEGEDISTKEEDAVRGTVVDGVFTNEVFKLSFPINDDWYVCSDSEIVELLGLTSDMLDENGDLTAEQFETSLSGTIYDLVFYFSDMQSNVNVTYINLDQMGMYATAPVDTYADLTVQQLENMTTTQYTIGDLTHETYGAKEWSCINASTDKGFDQKMLMRKENGYMVCVTITYFPDIATDVQAYLDSFTEVQ